jgi:hypothetical protein
MKISKEARKISKQLFLDSFVNGRLDEARVRNIARTLIDEKPANTGRSSRITSDSSALNWQTSRAHRERADLDA